MNNLKCIHLESMKSKVILVIDGGEQLGSEVEFALLTLLPWV